MPRRTVNIGSAQGLHARPAGIFARAVAGSGTRVTLGREGAAPVDAASLLGIMTLDLKRGETVILSADSEEADAVLEQLASLLASDLDAPTS